MYNNFMKGKKALVSKAEVVPRGIKYSWPTINKNIINVLKDSGFEVDIHVFNNNTEDKFVDGKKMNQDDIKIIPYTFYEEEKQKDIDVQIQQKCVSKKDCFFISQ